jgi:hypothetical protein
LSAYAYQRGVSLLLAYKDDKLHRADGAALITRQEWWKDGEQIAPPSDTAK